jgi:acetylornithine deacetylase/succinyl-diaminopimelate desuccinylase-like protein
MFGPMSAPDRAGAERVIEEARTICAVPAPTFAEGPRGELVADLLTAAGVAPRRDGVGNVVAQLGDGPAGETIVFAAHLDTVFAAGTEIIFREQGGRLAAPGIGDNSLAVAAIVHLARRLRGSALRRPVVLAATVGEEGLGDLRGAKALVDDGPCGAFVAVEGMMLNGLTVAAVGSVRFRLTVRGPGGHPWGDQENPSAIHGILRPLQAILDELTAGGVVVNVGVLTGGTVINAIAGAASAELDVRSEDDDALRRATDTVREAFAGLGPGLTADIEPLGHRPGGRLDPGHELLAAARSARRRAGLPEAPEVASSTDANAAHGRGIPAITVGVSTGANAHRLDEYIDLEPIPAGLASLEALVDELAGAS